MTDLFDRLVALRPEVPDEAGWAESEAGRRALSRVHREGARRRAWWQRRRIVIPTVLIGLGGAVGVGVAFSPAAREPTAGGVVCLDRTSEGADSYGVTTVSPNADHADIVTACTAQYVAMDHPAPTDFALCVFPTRRDQAGGAAMAVPTAVPVTAANEPALCQAAGYEPIR